MNLEISSTGQNVLSSRVCDQDVILEQVYCRLRFSFPKEVCGSESPGKTCIVPAGMKRVTE